MDLFNRALKEQRAVSFMFSSEKLRTVFDVLAFSLENNTFCMAITDATSQVAAERERREYERFTEKVFGSVDVWIVLLDELGKVVFWNAAAERLSGISADEALSGSFDFRSVFCPGEEDRGEIIGKMDACRGNEAREVRLDTCVCAADGRSLCVEWTVRPWRFEDVSSDGLLLLGRDVTQERRTEEKLLESERRYAAAFKETMAPMLLVDPETGAVCDCNDAALALYGYSREEMLALTNRDFNMLQAEELRKNMQEATARLRNRFVFPHRLKNGEIRTVEVYASPTPFQGKTFLFSILHDITEKQRLEERLHLLAFDCALQAKILGGILESSPDYLYVFDRTGRFRLAGKKGAALFERTPEEMTGLSWDLLGVPKERIAAFDEHLAQTFAKGKTKYGVVVLPATHGDMPLEYALYPVCGENGVVDMVFCSMHDVP
ncbi:MAG: PAS domain S-box protein [Synergistaceae bacterium]|nr:PAS domain S-box protein [Synergistaceae bacterium]